MSAEALRTQQDGPVSAAAGRPAEPVKKQPTAAQRMKQRRKRNALLRACIQAVFFVTMPGAFMAAFSGVKSIFLAISDGSALEMGSFVKALLGLGIFTILFGRFFCGFACAFGTMGDLVYWLSGIVQKKIFRRKKQIGIPAKFCPALQMIKYGLLAVIVSACGLGVYNRFNQYNWNPWSVFSFFTSLNFTLNGYVIGGILLAAIVAGMALKERFFCQFLCPMGAVFALLPQLPFSALQRDEANCIKGCQACKNNCPVDLKLEKDGFRGGECIACEKCAGICPKGNLTRWDRKLLKHEAVPVIIKAALLLGMGFWLGLARTL